MFMPMGSTGAGLRALIVLFALSLAITTPGCSILLATRAHSIRSNFPPGLNVPRERVAKIVPNAKVDLVLATGGSVSGHFERADAQSFDDYARLYEAWRRDSGSAFPALQSRVRLESAGAKTRDEKFVGFGWRSILVPGSHGSVRELPLSSFDTLRTAAGVAIASSSLTDMRIMRSPPCRTGILLRTPEAGVDADFERVSTANRDGTRFVPADAIEAIVIRGTVASPAVYFLVGLALDAAVVVAIAVAVTGPLFEPTVQCDTPSLGFYSVSVPGSLEPLNRDFDLRTGMPVPGTFGAVAPPGPSAPAP